MNVGGDAGNAGNAQRADRLGGVQPRPSQHQQHKEELDKENAAAPRVVPNGRAGVRPTLPMDSTNFQPSSRGSDVDEDMKHHHPQRAALSQRTVLEDVTHRYNSSSESYSGSDEMVVDSDGVESGRGDDVEVVQPVSRPPSLPGARIRSVRMKKRAADRSFTRSMR